MPVIEMICLANYYKYGGRCVAGLRTDGKGWIRLVTGMDRGELHPEQFTLDDGSPAQVLDVIRLDLKKHLPSPHQPENCLLGDGKWELVRRGAAPGHFKLLEACILNSPHLFGDQTDSDRIPFDTFSERPAESSLALVRPKNLRWQVEQTGNGNIRARAIFEFAGAEYNLGIADTVWKDKIAGSLEEGIYPCTDAGIKDPDEVLLTVSLSEPYEEHGYCYKIITGVIENPKTSEKKSRYGGDAPTYSQVEDVLVNVFGHESLRPGQEEVISDVFEGKNVLVVMPTGSGKSILYQLPAVISGGLTLVVSPLIALMKDQVDDMTGKGVPTTFINSSLSREEQKSRILGCVEGRYKLLYVAPERFQDESFMQLLGRVAVARLAIDEAHCISQWGHDFRPAYRQLKTVRQFLGNPPVSALTATATSHVQKDIIESLGLSKNDIETHVSGFDRPNLELSVVPATKNNMKIEFLEDFLERETGPGIIYTGTRRDAEDVAAALGGVEETVVAYHGQMEKEERSAAQDAFIGGKARVIAATNAFGMGIDKEDIRFIVHYSYPGSVESFYQEIGRAGRDGKTSKCVLLHASSDHDMRQALIEISYPGRKRVKSVYDVILNVPDNPILLTYKQIAQMCGEDIWESHVRSAIRLLNEAGVISAYTGEPELSITLDKPYSELSAKIHGPVRRRVLDAFASAFDLEKPGIHEIRLSELTKSTGLTQDQVRVALRSLRDDGVIGYEPKFKGRGIERLVDPMPPFNRVPIKWKHHDFLKRIEEEKLHAIEQYVNHRGCRREYVLNYFGEDDSFSCGTCDNCQSGSIKTGSVLDTDPDIAYPVMVCIANLPCNYGKTIITQVVRGSHDKRVISSKLDRNPAYGTVNASKDDVLNVIESLIGEGYLFRSGRGLEQVIKPTSLGRKLIREKLPGGRLPPDIKERARKAVNTRTDEKAARIAILDCVNKLPHSVGTKKTIEVLTGSKARWIRDARIDRLDIHGALKVPRDQISSLIEKLLKDGLLFRDGSAAMPVIHLTEKGLKELGGISAGETISAGTRVKKERPQVFDELKEWRLQRAGKEHVPAYFVASDKVLKNIAARCPVSKSQLLAVDGIGPSKLEKYGADILKIVGKHIDKDDSS